MAHNPEVEGSKSLPRYQGQRPFLEQRKGLLHVVCAWARPAMTCRDRRATMTVHGRPSAVLIAPGAARGNPGDHARSRSDGPAGRLGRGTGSRRARLRRATRRGHEAAPGAVSGEPAEEACELRATSAVRRALSKSPPEAVAAAACEFITGPLLLDPHQIGKRLLPPMDDRFCARRGAYRVIYRLDDKTRVVTVADVAHRRDVYRTCAAAYFAHSPGIRYLCGKRGERDAARRFHAGQRRGPGPG